MRFKIIGSGGCVSLPRPLCNCRVCTQAREKGYPYARCGCSLYVEDIHLLIDTPEDIVHALNNSNIQRIDSILYSHIDPDHTMGMRVIEQLRLNWLKLSVEGKACDRPIEISSLPQIIKDLREQGTKYGSALNYYEGMNLIKIDTFYRREYNQLRLELIPVDEGENVAIFVFTQDNHKVIYAPCDVKPFPDNEVFNNADYLIIGNTIIGDVLKNGFILKEDNPLRNELFVMDEIIEIKEKYNIKKVVMTHIEEDWGKTYDDYLILKEQYEDLEFAYDGLVIDT
ncbi:MAG: fold metallo-hydrolase [Anaerocolumna sp.]|jgi:phosphoribosyl 1,2-cyclic phosphate phosphodiesterase|nr:fold metallo-hydrolase [Anaerocolumna sp.]